MRRIHIHLVTAMPYGLAVCVDRRSDPVIVCVAEPLHRAGALTAQGAADVSAALAGANCSTLWLDLAICQVAHR